MCVLREPVHGPVRGLVVHVPAFAEEMNKSRRMVAWAARELAAAGLRVLVVDPLGCGDSAGDFEDASWEAWREDVRAAVDWLARDAGGRAKGGSFAPLPLWLWGLRAGALVACAALPSLPRDTSLLLWQPVASGRQHLAQFLRLAIGADGLATGAERSQTARLRNELAQGRSVEIGGYRLAPALAAGMEAASLEVPDDFRGTVTWIEVGGDDGAEPAPASRSSIAGLRAAGTKVSERVVVGPRFWQTVEIEDCPALVEATVFMLATSDDDAALDRARAAV